jgi:hypothetical protein
MRGGAQARFLARRADLGAGAKTVLVVVGRVGPHEPPLRGSLPLLPRPTFSPLRAPAASAVAKSIDSGLHSPIPVRAFGLRL